MSNTSSVSQNRRPASAPGADESARSAESGRSASFSGARSVTRSRRISTPQIIIRLLGRSIRSHAVSTLDMRSRLLDHAASIGHTVRAYCSAFASRAKVAQWPVRCRRFHACRDRRKHGRRAERSKGEIQAATAAAKQTKKKPDNATCSSSIRTTSRRAKATSAAIVRADSISSAARNTTRGPSSRASSKDEAMQNYIKQVEKLNRE